MLRQDRHLHAEAGLMAETRLGQATAISRSGGRQPGFAATKMPPLGDLPVLIAGQSSAPPTAIHAFHPRRHLLQATGPAVRGYERSGAARLLRAQTLGTACRIPYTSIRRGQGRVEVLFPRNTMANRISVARDGMARSRRHQEQARSGRPRDGQDSTYSRRRNSRRSPPGCGSSARIGKHISNRMSRLPQERRRFDGRLIDSYIELKMTDVARSK